MLNIPNQEKVKCYKKNNSYHYYYYCIMPASICRRKYWHSAKCTAATALHSTEVINMLDIFRACTIQTDCDINPWFVSITFRLSVLILQLCSLCQRILGPWLWLWYDIHFLTTSLHQLDVTYSAASGNVMPKNACDRHSVYISIPVPRM